jgi:hypothetical protein
MPTRRNFYAVLTCQAEQNIALSFSGILKSSRDKPKMRSFRFHFYFYFSYSGPKAVEKR